ncbi:MAG: 16S rRNA (adenine(1518)-N(6)/adenine(1519)-N(6))-dimethyltransferase RsmA [Planctomycetota bacterium]
MQTLTDIRRTLDERGMRPKHALGQNFLVDHNLITRLVDAAGVGPAETVLEVGPGTGVLTEALLERGARVVACELDDALGDLLEETIAPRYPETFELIRGDCLATKTRLAPAIADRLGREPFVHVANLPYACATPLLMVLLTGFPACRGMYVTVQREVGDRLGASASDGKVYGQISVVAQWLARVRTIATLPPACFWPRPEVTSAMIALERRDASALEDGRGEPVTPERRAEVAGAVAELFRNRRQTIGRTLKRLGAGADVCEGLCVPGDRVEALEIGAVLRLAARLLPAAMR